MELEKKAWYQKKTPSIKHGKGKKKGRLRCLPQVVRKGQEVEREADWSYSVKSEEKVS